jgi:hypothetical protein
MLEPFLIQLKDIIVIALIMLICQLAFIVLSLRFGWFVWFYKQIKKFRSKISDKKEKEEGHPQPEQ